MKKLWVVGLGLGIWGVSLLWPGINLLSAWWPVFVGIALASGGLVVTLIVESFSHKSHTPKNSGQNHPSRPVRVSGLR